LLPFPQVAWVLARPKATSLQHNKPHQTSGGFGHPFLFMRVIKGAVKPVMYRIVPSGTSCKDLTVTQSEKRESDRKDPGRYRLGDPVDGELEDFCKAMLDAKQSVVIRAAVSAFNEGGA
jgi:hypothetical protein